ncbi:hypothetical protein [Olleya namhaensis]|uniref:ApeA N-terminal domain 1-containing protein n=1 Tax=Olleya namhaensis TaxID=1144750 RepID=UPI0024927A12|nr:hypothetical protein [Olleya namhaensis]
MFKENKYFGEVWFRDSDNVKCFCVLEIKDGNTHIITNLSAKDTIYQIDIIYGMFNGLGYVTFVNCNIQNNSVGIVETKIYTPKYTFVCAYHFIDPRNLRVNEFNIDNAAIVKWGRRMNWYNSIEDKVVKQEDIKHQTVISENLTLTLAISTLYTSNHDFLRVDSVGSIEFKSQKNLNILESIELYNSFQKLFHFIYGKSVQFRAFNFKCINTGKWASLYYKDDFNKENISSFITLNYDRINEDLSKLIKHWFTNPDITYCADIIIENLLSVKTSHSRRFTNSYSAFEAYSFKFGKTFKNSTVEKYLLEHKELIHTITSIPENEIKAYVSNIIRHRDFLTHRNRINNNIFSQFELLYISFLLDYIVSLGLMKHMETSDKVLQKIILRAKSTYRDVQSVNKLLNQDILDDK